MAKSEQSPNLENAWFIALVNEDPSRPDGLAVYLVNATTEAARVTLRRSAYIDAPSSFSVGNRSGRPAEEDLGEMAPGSSVCLSTDVRPASDLCNLFWVTLHSLSSDEKPRQISFSAYPEDIRCRHRPEVEVPVLNRLAVAYLPDAY